MKRILVIDGNSMINRAYYGVRPLTTTSGKHTNAIFGLVNIVSRQLEAIRPDYAAVAFDLHEPTFRHKMYEHYKEGRHPTPPELLEQFDDAKEILSLMGLHVLSLPGYEADDIQGTVARMASEQNDTESFVLSGDRDLLQLIDEKTTVLLAGNTETKPMRRDEFFEKYHVEPEQLVDLKALMGDSSDHIPGVAGVGPKTAETLIYTFGSLDGVYENLEDPQISRGVREKLLRDRENAYLSQRLARIDTAVPLGLTLEQLAYAGMDRSGLYRKFTELELYQLIRRFHLEAASAAGEETAEVAPASPAREPAPLCEWNGELPRALAGQRIALLRVEDAIWLSDGKKRWCCHDGLAALAPLFTTDTSLICFDGKRLWHDCEQADISPSRQLRLLDLQLYAYVLNPGGAAATLPALYRMFLTDIPDEAVPSPDAMLELEQVLRDRIAELGMASVLDGLELPLIPVLSRMETAGFMVNRTELQEFADALHLLAEDLQSRIYTQAGGEFNLNSPKQLGELLFVRLGLPCKKKNNKNGFSTDAETLEELRPYSPIIDDILEYRQVIKLWNTYATVLPEVADEEGRIHTEFKQAMTATGRLSSADPNLQNIPVRTRMGRELRRCFIAKPGYSLVDADYSQIELRLLAHISGDYHMTEAFCAGEDIHRKTAAAVFGVPEEEVTDDMRKRAKAVNFGIVYGIGGFSLAKDIGTDINTATRYIKNYRMNYPMIDAYLDQVVEEARSCGYTTTLMGRRRYIPELAAQNHAMREFGKRIAMNAPIQGTAADIIKAAMIHVDERLAREGLDARLVMQVHDELIIEAEDSIVPRVAQLLREEMESVIRLSLPLTVEVTVGKNWLDQAPIA